MDINALKERLANMNKKTSKATDIWKPKDEHQVRLVANPHSADPFQELYFHNDVGDAFPFLCPKSNSGDDCAVCEVADQLRAWKDANGVDKPEAQRKQDFELFRKIQAKPRFYVPMVERGRESEGAKWLGMTNAQAQQVLDVCLDGDRLSEVGADKDGALKVLFDPDKAYDLNVSFAKPGEKGNTKQFTVITIKGRIKPSPLSTDKEITKKILSDVKDIHEILGKTTSEDVLKIVQKAFGTSGEEPSVKGGLEYTPKPPTNSKEDAKLSGTRSIDEAFPDMLS